MRNKKKFPEDLYHIDKTKAYFHKKGIALYEVRKGSQIDIYPYDDADHHDISEYLLNFPLALCLYQKNFLILHASAIEYKKNVLLFCGSSHSGKSTISNFFVNNGAKLITDDICAITLKDDMCLVERAYNYQKLTKNYIVKANIDAEKILTKAIEDNTRTGYRSSLSESSKHKVDYCFFIDSNTDKILPAENNIIVKNLLKYMYISKSENDYFELIDLANKIEFFNMGYEKNIPYLDKLLEDITKIINKNNLPL